MSEFSDNDWEEALTKQLHKLAEEWSVYRGAEDSASIAARELAIAYLNLTAEPSPVDRLNQGYEKIAQSQPFIQPKEHGRRSAWDRRKFGE